MNPYKISAKTAKGRAAMKSVGKKVGQPDNVQNPDAVDINEADDVEPVGKSDKSEDE